MSLSPGDILCEMEQCLSAMGDTEEAEECMRKAASTPPVRPENTARVAWFNYQLTGEADTAIPQLQQVLRKKDTAEVWMRNRL